jgi:membrane associated rhomboid family serine protease
MLEDRDYMRESATYEPRVSFTFALLIINAAVFVAELVTANLPQRYAIADFESQYLALSLAGLKHGYVWQLLTFQFMHAGWAHLILNSLAIFFFGRPVEIALGRRHFLTLYLLSGVIGGLVQMLFALPVPQYFGGTVVGASAGASGLVAAFALLHWEQRFTLFIYFFPVSMTGKTLLAASLIMAFLGMLTPDSGIANAAHLGGILTGGYYVRLFIERQWLRWKFSTRSRKAAPRALAARRAGKDALWRSTAGKPDDESTDEFVQNQVDPILEKISAHGIHSLTAREREILEKARKKMERR